MKRIEFERIIETGGLGRNGSFNVGGIGLRECESEAAVRLEPLTAKEGLPGRAFMHVPVESVGEVIRALADVAISVRPDLRETIAQHLRAAVLTVEADLDAPPIEGIASFDP